MSSQSQPGYDGERAASANAEPAGRRCPDCGEDFRMAWIGNDPPEPYGEVCGCPEVARQLREDRADMAAEERDRSDDLWFFDMDGKP